MKHQNFLVVLLLALLLAGCGKGKDEKDKPEEKGGEKAPAAESRVKHGTNDEVFVTIETNLQQKIGLETASLEPAQVRPEVKAYGHVLDPSGLASLVADMVTAQAAQQASQAELTRLKTLASQNNASERSVQAAEATAAHDQAQTQSVRLRLLAGWGSAISQRNDLPEFVQSLGSLASALVELEVPAGDAPAAMPTGARLYTLGDETKPLEAQVVGPAPSVDPQMQSRGFLLLVSSNSLGLAPGAAVTGYLSLPGEPKSGVLLPSSAVVRFGGTTWIYRQSDDDTFERQSVSLNTPLAKGWFVGAGLKSGDKVVTTGAQQLLSEELKGQGGGEE